MTLEVCRSTGGEERLAKYTKNYSTRRSVGFVIPLLALMIIGALYSMTAKSSQNGSSFILITIAAGFIMIYWVREIRKMSRPPEQKAMIPYSSEQQKRDWVYDLIKNVKNDEVIFVAEVPGPEDQIDIRVAEGILKIKGGQSFSKDIQLDMNTEMSISDYKYRNGVLTIKIQKV
jgi:HSP20 family molecular chaperone IbpA